MLYTIDLIREELAERREIGCDAAGLEAIRGDLEDASAGDGAKLAELWDRLDALEGDAELAAREPSGLEEIRALRPDGPRNMDVTLDDERLRDRVLGAWLGRAAGCTLGKPVEGWPRDEIWRLLRHHGEWPLADYFPPQDESWDGREWQHVSADCVRGRITHMVRDDDMDYTLLGLLTMEQYGPDFTPNDVANQFLEYLPYHKVYTAERYAYRNLVAGKVPPESATAANPAREWIGAQIRADFWGYVAPGRPELAAELACRDAVVTHTRNGIYGEMWMAATLAAAFAGDDPIEAMRVGLTEIPSRCRLADAINAALGWWQEQPDWEAMLEKITGHYGEYHPVHTINNALLVVLGVLDGGGALGQTICTAVMGGWDTDCNGASAGSIVGAARGAAELPYRWVGPLRDTMVTALSGVMGPEPLRFSDLADRTVMQVRRLRGTGA